MYTKFFGFRELPFNNTPDPRFFYSTPDHEEALASLIYAVKERKGFVLLTGEVGAGKTLLTRMMLRHFGTQIAFANINHAIQDPEDLMEAICAEFELPIEPPLTGTQLIRALHDFLLAQFARNIPVVLVLDEAQNLPVEGFEQLRTIGNLEADDAKLLQIAIVGQPELQDMFLSPKLRQLKQRLFRSFHLTAMSPKETTGYIRHRLSVVSEGELEIFTKDAITAVHEASDGLPRLINTLCDNALLSAYSADRRKIDGPLIESVVGQMMMTSRRPFDVDHAAVAQPDSPMGRGSHQGAGVRTPAAVRAEPRPNHAAAGILDGLAQRLARLETRLGAQGGTVMQEPRSAPTASQDPPPQSFTDEIERIWDQVRAATIGTDRRIGALGQRLTNVSRELGDAREVRVELEGLVARANAVVGKVSDASRKLERREAHVRKVTDVVGQVVHDLRDLLDRAEEVTAKTGRAHRQACSVHARLATQSRHSRTLVNELANVMRRAVPESSSNSDGASTIKEASVPAEFLAASGLGTASLADASENVHGILKGTRASLRHLRDLAQGNRVDEASPVPESSASPTTRLTQQVESLLKLIEQGSDQPSDQTHQP